MKQNVENLIHFQIKRNIITSRDYVYVKNQLYFLLDLILDYEVLKPEEISYPSDALDAILDILEKQGKLNGSQIERDLFDAKIMNVFASLPSTVQKTFESVQNIDKTSATDFLYNYAKSLNYVRTNRTDKNIWFESKSKYGKLEITINLSKPEKDPKSIAMAAKQESTAYPKCVLCKENEGFSGNTQRESRDQHRLISFDLLGEEWFFQYSPYIYYNEHAIVFSGEHKDMKISELTFKRLLTLTEKFNGYFFGSNSDLPIVGGSILSHEHYQGGKYTFPIEHASSLKTFNKNNVTVDLLNWPLSTVRLRSTNKDELLEIANDILHSWKAYSNDKLNLKAFTNEIPHHTITPIARIKNGEYELDLILRDNQTSEQHPSGIYHPHSDKWNIKKENIGLIEAIGLAILPARLLSELKEVKEHIINNQPLTEKSLKHQDWLDKFKNKATNDNIDEIINQELSNTFEAILEDCGVFKINNEGTTAFINFISEVLK